MAVEQVVLPRLFHQTFVTLKSRRLRIAFRFNLFSGVSGDVLELLYMRDFEETGLLIRHVLRIIPGYFLNFYRKPFVEPSRRDDSNEDPMQVYREKFE